MPSIIIPTYEGILCGYELQAGEEGMQFEQIINSQEGKLPLRAVAVIEEQIFIASGAIVTSFSTRTKRMTGKIEFKDRVERLINMGDRLFVVAGEMIRVCDSRRHVELMAYHGSNGQILDVCGYEETKFCSLVKDKLVAFSLNSPKALGTLTLPGEFQQAAFYNEKEILLINSEKLIKFNIDSQTVSAEFTATNLYGFHLDEQSRNILVGTAAGELLVLNANLKKLAKVQLGQNRIKKIIQLDEGTYIAIQSNGTITVFAFDATQNAVLLVGEHTIQKRPMDIALVCGEEMEQQAEEEGEEEGFEEDFEELLELEEGEDEPEPEGGFSAAKE